MNPIPHQIDDRPNCPPIPDGEIFGQKLRSILSENHGLSEPELNSIIEVGSRNQDRYIEIIGRAQYLDVDPVCFDGDFSCARKMLNDFVDEVIKIVTAYQGTPEQKSLISATWLMILYEATDNCSIYSVFGNAGFDAMRNLARCQKLWVSETRRTIDGPLE